MSKFDLNAPAELFPSRNRKIASKVKLHIEDDLEVIFKSEKPSIIAGFLKNKRMWPDYWEFLGPGEADVPADKPLVFHWAPGEKPSASAAPIPATG